LPQLLTVPSRFWAIGPRLHKRFSTPACGALTDQAIAAFDANVAAYRQAVLGGFQKWRTTAALRILEEEANVQEGAVQAGANRWSLLSTNIKQGR
jgi:outer membrane protein TolC